jgi:uncharacterized membrane protein YphA (DoxX/SURF4 family)
MQKELAPLVLRLALGLIFIYHGGEKVVIPKNDWGTHWATNLWKKESAVPPEVQVKLIQAAKEQGIDPIDILKTQKVLEKVYETTHVSPPPTLAVKGTQVVIAWGEIVGGVLILVGFLTRLASAFMVIIQLGAIATLTWYKGFSFGEGGFEHNIALIAMSLALICLGSGAYALDKMWRPRTAAT